MSKEEKSEGSRWTDSSQLNQFIKSIKSRYSDRIIKEAVQTLPWPEEPSIGKDDVAELKDIFNGLIKAFSPQPVFDTLIEFGYERPIQSRELYDGGGISVNLNEVVAWEIGGKFESNTTGDKKNVSNAFSRKEMQITMLGKGFIRFIFKGGEEINKSLYDVLLFPGDTVSIFDSSLTVKHLSEQTQVSGATYAQPTADLT